MDEFDARARLLFVGDIHLGRRPTRLPEDLEDYGLAAGELGPAAAWRSSVDAAIAAGADAVVLAGDVVEKIDDRFEAYAHLQSGVARLVEAGIPVFGVAGNHDVEALPRLADQIPGFHLLGRGGAWERASVDADVPIDLVGWSFPHRVVSSDPVADLPRELLDRSSGATLLGVLHCDLDGGSHYAPVSRDRLEQCPVDGWLLGHVHLPSDLSGDRPLGYLGSLVGLDPGEPGAHGPSWVEVDAGGRVRATRLPLAPLRWERVELDVARLDERLPDRDAAVDPEDLADVLHAAVREALRDVRDRVERDAHTCVQEGARARAVLCRVKLVGRTRFHHALRPLLASGLGRAAECEDGVHYFVERIEDEARPALDLGRIAVGSDPAALLARRLVALEAGGPEADRLIAGAEARMGAELARTTAFDRLELERDDVGVDRERVRIALLHSGTRALEDLLAQREATDLGGAV